jgi:hypothetical protein
MQAILVVLSGFVAIAVGIEVFVAIFFAPVVIYGSDAVMLAWGWIAPFLGLPVGALAAWLTFLIIDRTSRRQLASGAGGWFKASAVVTLALVGAAFAAQAMRTAGDVDVGWSEEVLLSDRDQILIKRRAIGNAFGRSQIHPEDWLPAVYTMEASAGDSEFSLAPWRSSLRPVLLDRDPSSKNWFVLAEPIDCAKWYTLGKPSPPYVMYVLGPTGWVETRVDERLLGMSPNLLVSPRFTREEALVSVTAQKKRNEQGPVDARRIIRAVSKC